MPGKPDPIYGDLPHGWAFVSLDDLSRDAEADIQTGPFGTLLHASAYRETGTPVVAVKNIGENRLVEEDIPRVDDETRERLSRYQLRTGDILFGRKGSVERRAYVHEGQEGWLQGSDCIRLRLRGQRADARFVSYTLGTPQCRNWIIQNAHGATMPSLNQEIIGRIPVPLPPLREQQAIACILGALDDKIELNRRMNRTLEGLARAIFQSWFVDFDPVRWNVQGRHAKPQSRKADKPKPPLASSCAGDFAFSPKIAALFPNALEDSELGQIPTGWQMGSVLNVADLLSGGTPKTAEPRYWDGSIPWASAKDVSQCGEAFLISTERTITQQGLDNSATQIIPALSSVVVARGATTGRMTMFGSDMAMNQTCYALRTNRGTPRFLYMLLRSAMRALVHAAHGSVFDTITTSTFRSSRMLLPAPEVARAFEEVATSLFDRVLASLHQSRMLAALRDALLPKLISGELRVRHAERIVGRMV
jgi:type I restriction enzyme S subunit